MNFLNLYYFRVAAEELSFTNAAKRLFISQQSLSSLRASRKCLKSSLTKPRRSLYRLIRSNYGVPLLSQLIRWQLLLHHIKS